MEETEIFKMNAENHCTIHWTVGDTYGDSSGQLSGQEGILINPFILIRLYLRLFLIF